MDTMYSDNKCFEPCPPIGLVGKIGVGKTTAQKYYESGGREAYNLAGPLKKIGLLFGFTQEQKLKPNKFWGVSSRHFLQKFGTEICRQQLPKVVPEMSSIWVQLFMKYVRDNPRKKLILGDVRFLDEAAAVKKMGGILIRINRKTEHRGAQTKHASELEQDKIVCDFTIDNCGTLEELHQKLRQIC